MHKKVGLFFAFFFGLLLSVKAQSTIVGENTDEDMKFKIDCYASGGIKKIKLKNGKYKVKEKFPEKHSNYEWVQIRAGVWINKGDEKELSKKYDKKQKIVCHYYGAIFNGEKFDDSFSNNKLLKGTLGMFIKGFGIGAYNIEVGEFRVIKISPEMGYGNKKRNSIPPNSTLVFYIYRAE